MYFKLVHISILLFVNNFKSIDLFHPHSFDEPFHNTSPPLPQFECVYFFINQSCIELQFYLRRGVEERESMPLNGILVWSITTYHKKN
jgi:hypothetical protein